MLNDIPNLGQAVTPADLNKVIRHVNTVTDIRVSSPLEVTRAAGNTQIRFVEKGFPAAVTGRTDLGAGGATNRWLYTVAEVIQAADGKWELKDNGRTLDGGIKVWEWSDSKVAVGTVVWVDQWGTYEWRFAATGGGGGVNDANCDGCGWLAEEIPHTAALQVSIPSALGRCACINSEQATDDDEDADNQFYLLWDADSSSWKGMKNFRTCCGCGTITFTQDTANLTGTLTLDINRSCDSGASYSYAMTHECCRDGQITFVGWGPDNCDGDPIGCVNIFRIKVECAEFPECLTCECPACTRCCTAGEAPTIWQLTTSGWTGDCAVVNGTWFLRHIEACHWQYPLDEGEDSEAGCGFTIDMDFYPDPGGDPEEDKFKIVISSPGGTVTYQINARDGQFDCCGSNTLARVGGAICGSPFTTSITPAACAAACDPDKQCFTPPPEVFATFDGILSAIGTVTMTWQPMSNSYRWGPVEDTYCFMPSSSGFIYFGAGCNAASGTDWIGQGEGANGFFTSDQADGSCDPFIVVLHGSGTCGGVSGDFTVTLTE